MQTPPPFAHWVGKLVYDHLQGEWIHIENNCNRRMEPEWAEMAQKDWIGLVCKTCRIGWWMWEEDYKKYQITMAE